MQFHGTFGRLALATLLIGSVAACGDDNNGITDNEAGAATLTGEITANRTLSNDTVYTLQGLVSVAEGVTLTIQRGTTILGDATVLGTFLLVRQGAKIEAVGTPEQPIVFTSSRAEGQRRRGDWGGVVINGRAPCNFGPTCQAEGDAGTYGGNQPTDDSGTLQYVRIEYVGFEVSEGNELNGLTLNGVGNQTEIDHVQIHFGLDDGIEFFGGTVNVKYALVTGAEDDSFDYSTGWQGFGQFWLVQQDPQIGDKGFEVDGNEDNDNATPLTDPRIYNVTLVGKGPSGNTSTEVSPGGVQLRRGTSGQVFNVVVLGFVNGIDVDGQVTADRCQSGELVFSNAVFGDISGQLLDPDSDTFEQLCTSQPSWAAIRQATEPVLTAPYNLENPDFRPVADSPALSGFATPPSNGFFESVNYVGAVAPTGPNSSWYQGWTTTERG